jgi:hypothetical protein
VCKYAQSSSSSCTKLFALLPLALLPLEHPLLLTMLRAVPAFRTQPNAAAAAKQHMLLIWVVAVPAGAGSTFRLGWGLPLVTCCCFLKSTRHAVAYSLVTAAHRLLVDAAN